MARESVYLKRSYAEQYDRDRFEGAFGQYLYDHEVATYLAMVERQQAEVLDLGAGTGKLALALIQKGCMVTAADMSAEMLRLAQTKARRAGKRLRAVICDAEKLCFRDQSFDFVVSSRMLMHLDDWKMALGEICRVARKAIVVDFPPLTSFGGLQSVYRRWSRFFGSSAQTYKAFLAKEIVREIQRQDYGIVSVQRHFALPIAFHRWMDNPRWSARLEELSRRLGLVSLLGAPVTLKANRKYTIQSLDA